MDKQRFEFVGTSSAHACNVLMIYPKFATESFWNFAEACELIGARYPAIPLGLITVAALLPKTWTVRLVNLNTEDLAESDLAWADMVMTGGMMLQQADTLRLIDMCRARDLPVVIGGPDATSSPHRYETANFRVLGEVEGIIHEFIAAWDEGKREGMFVAPKFQIDVTKTPIPRFDLLKFEQYLYIGVQFSRGCPFTCEFCDIIELYGRVPRAKTHDQMLAELEALYQLGYRGHIDFVDDNLIGNKKAIKAFLPVLQKWIEQHDYPFEFSTEASLNLADDAELLDMLKRANFFGIFVGIESPDEETLKAMRKKQNMRRSIAGSVHKIYSAGMLVTGGFIVGFDTEKGSVAGPMIDLIEEAAIPIPMIGLLYALPNTQLTRRLAREGRLHVGHDVSAEGKGDQCTAGVNFETKRPRVDVLRDYRNVLEAVYDPDAFCGRLERLAAMLDCSLRKELPEGDIRRRLSTIKMVHELLSRLPEGRERFWKAFTTCMSINPQSVRGIVTLMAFYLHVGPYSRHVMKEIDRQIEALEQGRFVAPQLLPPTAPEPVAVNA
ncbi:MAG TPA: B12-binding domain-containing radical SAM protein [Steroidobacteraceae bacterium]|nr:B12-binding domain-containing radical SAM protein [Steroidobacteraceae bacterium]